MNIMKKIILSVVLVLGIIGIMGFVIAVNWAGESAAPIYKGWNLVYGFASPDQLDGQGFEKSHIKAIYAFIPTTQEYARAYPNPETDKLNKIDDDEIMQHAFWVYSDYTFEGSLNNKLHYIEYWLNEEPITYTERPLYKGWNFFGVTPDIVGKNMNDIKGDCNIERIYNWDAESQQWSNGLVGATVGSGVLIKVTDNCEFAEPIEDITPPPVIPN